MSSNVFAANVHYAGNVIMSQSLTVATLNVTTSTSTSAATFSATPAAAANVLTVIGSSTTGNVVQFSNSAGGTFIMTNAGRIGIGTVSPLNTLDVYGSQIIRNSTVYTISSPAWYNIGLWVSVGGGRLRLELIGGSGYDNSVDSQYQTGGVTTIYASILNNSSAARANCGGTWKHDGALACVSAVKFVQGADRFSYYVYVNLNSYTEHGLKIDTTKGSGFTPSFTVTTDPGANSATVQAAAFTMITGYGSSSTVGIGVTNPQVLLAAVGTCTLGNGAGTTTAAYHTGMVNIIGGGTRALLRIENNNSVGSPGIIFGEGGGFTEDTQPTIKKVQGTNNLAIMCGGNVGIGTVSPANALQVAGTAATISVGGTASWSNVVQLGNVSYSQYGSVSAYPANRFTILTSGLPGVNDMSNGNGGLYVASQGLRLTGQRLVWAATSYESAIEIDGGRSPLAAISHGQIRFYTANAQRAVIDESGNVGIGTTNPAVALDIISTNAGIRVQEPNYGITTRIISEANYNASNRWWLLATFSYSSYHIFDVDANLSRIDSAPCDVKFGFAGAYSSSVATQISRSENRGTVGNGYFQAWYNSTTGVIDVWLFASSYTPTMLTMKYYGAVSANLTANWTTSAPTTSATYVKQWDTSVNSTYTQLSGGNVGIGNTTPPVKLWVPATSTSTGIGVYNSDVALIIGNAAGGTNAGSIQVKSSGSSSAIGATNYTLALNPNGGNVGIETASPSYKLEVSNTTSSTSTSFLGLTNPYAFGFNTGLNIGSSIVYSSRWQGDGGSGVVEMCKIDGRKEQNANYGDSYLAFQTRYETNRSLGGAGTLTEKMRISGFGNVGIGITNPGFPLEVASVVTNNFAASYGFYSGSGFTTGVTGNQSVGAKISGYVWSTNGFLATSDARIKIVNPEPISNCLDAVNQLRVCKYEYIDKITDKSNKLGFIAQEVRQVIPESVTISESIVPNIFKMAESVQSNVITIADHGLVVGDTVKLVYGSGAVETNVCVVRDASTFQVEAEIKEESVFVYGKKVNDFLTLDHTQVFTCAIGAIKELSTENTQLKTQMASLEQSLANFSALEARLAALEGTIGSRVGA